MTSWGMVEEDTATLYRFIGCLLGCMPEKKMQNFRRNFRILGKFWRGCHVTISEDNLQYKVDS